MPNTHELPSEITTIINSAFDAALENAGDVDPSDFELTKENCETKTWLRILNYFKEEFGENCEIAAFGACDTKGCGYHFRPATWRPAGCGPRCITCH